MSSNVRLTDKNTSDGFLSGFVEASVEKPDDGLNGDCIVHYAGKHSKYEMTVKLVNGVREGEAMIVNDGVPYLRLKYKQGSLTGKRERCFNGMVWIGVSIIMIIIMIIVVYIKVTEITFTSCSQFEEYTKEVHNNIRRVMFKSNMSECSFFNLSSFPMVKVVDIGDYCFYNAPSFSLTGMID